MAADMDEVTAFLHREIPLTGLMGVVVCGWDGAELRMRAPLGVNSNHEDTAFGGSLATLGIVAGWTWVHLRMQEAGLKGRLVISRSETHYLMPLAGDLGAVVRDGLEEWGRFVRSVTERGRGRIRVRVELGGEGGGVAAVHEGVYVVVGDSQEETRSPKPEIRMKPE